MRELWDSVGALLLCIIIWCSILFSETIFGDVYGQPFENLIVGMSCLLFLTLSETKPWFGIKNLRLGVFLTLGIVNICLGIIPLFLTN